MERGEAWVKTYVLLPAYNEVAAIGRLLGRLANVGCVSGVAVVDDGSTDGTADAAQACGGDVPCVVIRHGKNQGLGAAMATGLRWAMENLSPHDVLVAMDADDTHDPGLIPRMLERMDNGADVVIASRFRSGGGEVGVPVLRRVLSHSAGRFLRIARPIPGVRDYSCGFRAYRVGALQAAQTRYPAGIVTTSGFACMVELAFRLAAAGCRFEEVPLLLRYDRKQGSSKMRVARTIWKYAAVLRAVPRSDITRGQEGA